MSILLSIGIILLILCLPTLLIFKQYANKVERQVAKSAAAMLLSSRIGDQFDAICTGAADKGTWVRTFQPPIEGLLLHGYEGVDVGHRLRVKLINVDVDRGFIDFETIRSNP